MSDDTYHGVPITRVPSRRDYEHERMWALAAPRSNARRRYPTERLNAQRGRLIGYCDANLRNR